jgi:hypothetical protein
LPYQNIEHQQRVSDKASKIEAYFPAQWNVCNVGEPRGFFQQFDRDCHESGPSKRAMGVMTEPERFVDSQAKLEESFCIPEAETGTLALTAEPNGMLTASCFETELDRGEFMMSVVISPPRGLRRLGLGGLDSEIGGYSAMLITNAAHREEDEIRFRTFLQMLRVGDISLRVSSKEQGAK